MRRTHKGALTLSAAFDQVLREVRANETASIKAGKWTMFAYFRDMGETFERLADGTVLPGETRDDLVLYQMRYLVQRGEAPIGLCAEDGPSWVDVARRMALAVYGRKVLRLAGYRVPHPHRQQAWLKAQQRFTEEGDVIVDTQEGTNNVRYARG